MSSSISLCTSMVLLPEKSRPLWIVIAVKLTWGIVSYRPPCCFFCCLALLSSSSWMLRAARSRLCFSSFALASALSWSSLKTRVACSCFFMISLLAASCSVQKRDRATFSSSSVVCANFLCLSRSSAASALAMMIATCSSLGTCRTRSHSFCIFLRCSSVSLFVQNALLALSSGEISSHLDALFSSLFLFFPSCSSLGRLLVRSRERDLLLRSLWLGDPLEWLLLVSRERDLSSYLL
jgi:hypothetical protein